jgi:hypothetical protein
MAVLPQDIMIDILLRVRAENPLHIRCVCKFWNSLIVHPDFMNTHIVRSTSAIFEILQNALTEFSDFELEYITNNLVRRQENRPDDEEITRVVKAFDEVGRIWNTVQKLCDEEKEKNQGDIRIAFFNHMLMVVIYMKENFNIMRERMQDLEDRIRCFQSCCRIHSKSVV